MAQCLEVEGYVNREVAGGEEQSDASQGVGSFDGIICFGGVDWWYHNRGHYDLQIMRELTKRVPVLYVNSIGMKAPRPSEGAMFAKRVLRKIRSLRRGLQEVKTGFFVYSAPTLPGTALSSSLVSAQLAYQVRRCARRIGMRRPLLWIACPPAAHLVGRLDTVGTVYQRTDRMEHFEGVDTGYISRLDIQLKSQADLTVFCSRELYGSEQDDCREAAFVDHGVDFDRFAAEGVRYEQSGVEPDDVRGIARPRVGFVGGIDSHTFDARLFREVAGKLPHCQFVMVGACSLPEGWCSLDNVHFFGQRPYEDVASYMAACDVLIMPWNQNEWIKACNPVKLKEYLAAGRPVVSTPFPELAFYADYVSVAQSAEKFAAQIEGKIASPDRPEFLRDRVRSQTWERKALDICRALGKVGLSVRTPQGAVR